MTIETLPVLSCDGQHTLYARLYRPDEAPKAVFQIVHGMCEYHERYLHLIRFLTDRGYLCVAHDHLGHGHTAVDRTECGFFAEKDGWRCLVEDVHRVYAALPEADAHLPHFLLGHSMGSFIARLYATAYPLETRALIIMGTGAANPLGRIGQGLSTLLTKCRGSHHVSALLLLMAFGSYNLRFREEKSPYSWLSSQKERTEMYAMDPLCSFALTTSAMHDLITLNVACNTGKWFKSFPQNLPVLLVSGKDDPVGNYGKGVKTVCDRLRRAGVRQVNCRMYENARHEILNDYCCETVMNDVFAFCEEWRADEAQPVAD